MYWDNVFTGNVFTGHDLCTFSVLFFLRLCAHWQSPTRHYNRPLLSGVRRQIWLCDRFEGLLTEPRRRCCTTSKKCELFPMYSHSRQHTTTVKNQTQQDAVMLCFASGRRRCPGDFLWLRWSRLALCLRSRLLGRNRQRAVPNAVKDPLRMLCVPDKPARKAATDSHLRDMNHVLYE